ncbi:MAG: ABC transporter ATP-binding protein [Steroidobacteraceae bacterium]|nr:ABC transporter ATP-binding protein [Steroidobacteraceae bacterium]
MIPSYAKKLLSRGPKDTDLQDSEFWALRNVSFSVAHGQALGIIGQNGAGKSTVLKLLTRILRPTIGDARVVGRVGALIEISAGFHQDLTGRENIFLQGAIMGMRRKEIQRHFDAIVDFSGLEQFIDTPVKRYSSGMNARLGFSIAAHLDPSVLLIDEVLAVGDVNFQQKCYDRLRTFRASGAAIAFVSHNMQAVANLCDSAILLHPTEPPLLGPVADVMSGYFSAISVSNPNVQVMSATLADDGGTSVDKPIAPDAMLTLRARIECKIPLSSFGVSLRVTRSDGLLMFNGISTADRVRPLDIDAGGMLSLNIRFRAALLRGTYRVDVALFHAADARQWPEIVVNGIGTFTIAETNRVGGCVELAPLFDLSVPRSVQRP